MQYVFGYTVAHDVSARDWQMHRNGGQFLIGKSMDGFCPLGPAIVMKEDLKGKMFLEKCSFQLILFVVFSFVLKVGQY